MTTKNVYSHNDNLCFGVCMMVFMRIDTFFLIMVSMVGGI